MGGKIFKKLIISFTIALLTFSFVIPTTTQAAPILPIGDFTNSISGGIPTSVNNAGDLVALLWSFYSKNPQSLTIDAAIEMATNFASTPEFTDASTVKMGSYSMVLNENCNHDYFCYVWDNPINNASPIKLGLIINKVTKNAFVSTFTIVPSVALIASFNPFKNVIATSNNALYLEPASSPWPTATITNQQAAPLVYQVKPVNVANGPFGNLVFDQKPENPDFINNLFKSSALFYWGTDKNAFDFAVGAYDNDKTVKFQERINPFFKHLYTNTPYTIFMFAGDGTVDCLTGKPVDLTDPSQTARAATGNVCSIDYTGRIHFTLDANGKITMINPQPGEEANNGKTLAQALFIKGAVHFTSPLDKALATAIKAVAGFVESALKFFMGWNYNLLITTPKFVLSPGVEGAWTNVRNIGLTLLVLALLIIAFANVLGLDIQTYGLNRMIPRIIIAIIFTYFSWLIVQFFFDFTAAIQAQAIGLVGGHFGLDMFDSRFVIQMPVTGEIVGKMGVIILFITLFFFILVCSIILWFSLLLRVIMLAFLLAVAPLAMIFSIMPFTETLYKRWWAEFWKWMFMGPVAIAVIALGYIIASGFGMGAGTITYNTVEQTSPSSNLMMGLVIFAASLVMAASLPLQWGGKAMGSWRKAGKNLWGSTGGAALNGLRKSAWDRTGGSLNRKYGAIFRGNSELRHKREEQEGAVNRAKLAQSKWGRRVVGATPDEAATLAEAAITGAQKKATEQAKLDPAALLAKRAGLADDSFEARGIDRALLDTGKYNNRFVNPQGSFQGAQSGVIISTYDRATGGLVDAKNYSAADFGNNQADYDAFKAHLKAEGNRTSIAGARAAAARGTGDKVFRDLAKDKLAKGAALAAKAYPADKDVQSLYRDVESSQKGKKATEVNHDFVENSANSYLESLTGRYVKDAMEKANPKVQDAFTKRLIQAKLDRTLKPEKMAELEAAYTQVTGKNLPNVTQAEMDTIQAALNNIPGGPPRGPGGPRPPLV